MYRTSYRFLASFARLAVRSGRSKDIEIAVLRHQLAVLRRQHGRPALNDDDRSLLGAIAQALPRPRRQGLLVTPDTLLRWHRRRIARHWTQPAQTSGRPSTDAEIRRRYYLLFFIDVTSRQVSFAGITANPTGPWTTQAARNLFLRHPERLSDARALVRDRGSQFIDTFDEIFRTEGFKILKTPVRTPVANTFAERWIGSLRRELLDRTIIWNQHQLERLVNDYIDHYNAHRPHRSLDQRPPLGNDPQTKTDRDPPQLRVVRSARCDGLINEYRNSA